MQHCDLSIYGDLALRRHLGLARSFELWRRCRCTHTWALVMTAHHACTGREVGRERHFRETLALPALQDAADTLTCLEGHPPPAADGLPWGRPGVTRAWLRKQSRIANLLAGRATAAAAPCSPDAGASTGVTGAAQPLPMQASAAVAGAPPQQHGTNTLPAIAATGRQGGPTWGPSRSDIVSLYGWRGLVAHPPPPPPLPCADACGACLASVTPLAWRPQRRLPAVGQAMHGQGGAGRRSCLHAFLPRRRTHCERPHHADGRTQCTQSGPAPATVWPSPFGPHCAGPVGARWALSLDGRSAMPPRGRHARCGAAACRHCTDPLD